MAEKDERVYMDSRIGRFGHEVSGMMLRSHEEVEEDFKKAINYSGIWETVKTVGYGFRIIFGSRPRR